MTRADVIDRPKVEKVTEPSKRWWNWYVSHRHYREQCGRRHYPDEVFRATLGPHPSKDVAEAKAASFLSLSSIKPAYLGAFPEGVTPP